MRNAQVRARRRTQSIINGQSGLRVQALGCARGLDAGSSFAAATTVAMLRVDQLHAFDGMRVLHSGRRGQHRDTHREQNGNGEPQQAHARHPALSISVTVNSPFTLSAVNLIASQRFSPWSMAGSLALKTIVIDSISKLGMAS